MRRLVRKVMAVILGVVIIAGVPSVILASEAPDLERTGSISFTVSSGDEAVGGGTISVFLWLHPLGRQMHGCGSPSMHFLP